ncbi:MAG: N-acetylmuramoyl-L-alanine amidase [Desulfobacterales bacterium]|nr:MAG: N-acetylmuramoyl-L-alanine amidase [Desulfobacterales bacterium]
MIPSARARRFSVLFPGSRSFSVCLCVLWFAVLVFTAASSSFAETTRAERLYYAAEARYNAFLADDKDKKFRDNWKEVIRDFRKAYQSDTTGILAPASLFMTGEAWRELYYISGLARDRIEAMGCYKRVIRRYPESRYRKRAGEELEKLRKREKSTKEGEEAKIAASTEGRLHHLTPRTEKSGHPRPEAAPDISGPDSEHRIVRRRSDAARSKEAFRAARERKSGDDISRIIAGKTGKRKGLGRIAGKVGRTRKPAASKLPKAADPAGAAPEGTRADAVAALPSDPVIISGMRVWSNPNYTRIVIDADRDTTYDHELLDAAGGKPQRLYVDFQNSRLGRNIDTRLPVNDNLLQSARAGQTKPDVVRVVADLKSFRSYKLFSLKNPFRAIIDIWGADTRQASRPVISTGTAAGAKNPEGAGRPASSGSGESGDIFPGEKLNRHGLAQQLGLGVRRIVIDAGHGGHDPGAIGYKKSVHEKDIALQISKRLARKIRTELKLEALLTRDRDTYLHLEERTAIANTRNADLFISIHCNAAASPKAYGMETYFLNLATDEDAVQVAVRENAASRKNISDLQAILNDLMQNAKINESSRLAGHIQKSMVNHMKSRYSKIKNKGVKKAPFYVLLGARMPSVLVEVSFISNPRECNRLTNSNYQEHLAAGILAGIRGYIRENNPRAFLPASSPRRKG